MRLDRARKLEEGKEVLREKAEDCNRGCDRSVGGEVVPAADGVGDLGDRGQKQVWHQPKLGIL